MVDNVNTPSQEDILNKAIDQLVEELFTTNDAIQKMDVGTSHTLADEALAKVPNSPKDTDRAERPKQLTQIPEGQGEQMSEGTYDKDITSNLDEELQPEEAKTQSNASAPTTSMNKSISEEEYNEYQSLKAERIKLNQEQELEKSQKLMEQVVARAVEATAAKFQAENSDLKKSVEEMKQAFTNMASKPQARKSIESVVAIEKSQKKMEPTAYSRQEVLQAVEDLVLSKSHPQFKIEHIAEMEQFGNLSDPSLRKDVENYLNRKS